MPLDPDSPYAQLSDVVYFSHRLKIANTASDLPASVKFDIARSPLPAQAVQDAAGQFGSPAPGNGWGLSSFLDHLVSTQPDTIKVDDLAKLQDNLVRGGYLPQTFQSTGEWSPEAAAAFKQFEYDQHSDFYSGNHPLATSDVNAVSFLGWTLPAAVFQGLVGAAKGFVEQAPETAGRVGLVGGAAAGAGIGASVGAVFGGVGAAPGAVVGGAIGATVGFFGDLLSHDPSTEQDQSAMAKVVDAITPFEEYTGEGGSKKFFEDLGWVGTASSMVMGLGVGAKAVLAGKAAISASAAAADTSFLSASLVKGTVERPSWMAKILLQPAKFFGKDAYTHATDMVAQYGFMAQATRPLMKDIVVPAFTGLSKAQLGARMVSNLGQGETPSTIRQAIDAAPLPDSTLVNLSAFVIYPTGFLPWKAGDIAKGVNGMLGEADEFFTPFVNWVRNQNSSSFGEATASAKALLGENPAEQVSTVAMFALQHGVEAMAGAQLKAEGVMRYAKGYYPRLQSLKYRIANKIIAETGTNEPLMAAAGEMQKLRETAGKASSTDAPTLQEAMSYAFFDKMNPGKGPHSFEANLMNLSQEGSGLEQAKNFFGVNEVVVDVTSRVRTGELTPMTLSGKRVSPGNLPTDKAEILSLVDQRNKIMDEISLMDEVAGARTLDPKLAVAMPERMRAMGDQVSEIDAQIEELKRSITATWEDRMVGAMRLDTPSQRTYAELRKEYTKLQESVFNTMQAENSGAHQIAKEQMSQWLLQHEDLLPPPMAERARTASRPSNEVSNHLKVVGKGAAQDIVLPEEEMARFTELGFKPVLVHNNNFIYRVDHRITEITGLGDYTRRQDFWQSMGLGLNKDSNAGIAKMRQAGMEAAVSSYALERDFPISGRQVMSRLWRGLRESNYRGVVSNESVRGITKMADDASITWGPFIIRREPAGGIAFKYFAADLRELKPGDVFEALRDIPGFTHTDAQGVFGALKSGAAMGSEMSFLHPIRAAHDLGKLMRVNGLYGFPDLMRTWHAEVPNAIPKGMEGYLRKVQYKIPEVLAKSAERARYEGQFRTAVVKIGLKPEEETLGMMMVDSLAQGAIAAHPDIYPTADAFFSKLDASFAEKFAGGADSLLKRVSTAPSMDDLMALARENADNAGWYERAAKTISEFHDTGSTTLRNGETISNHELMLNLIAATSPLKDPGNNWGEAMKVALAYSKGEDVSLLPNVKGMVDDILSGHTIDKWGPPRGPSLKNAARYPNVELHGRPKVWNFYHNLKGEMDKVTVDTWMGRLFGYEKMTSPEYAAIEGQIRDISERLGWAPAQTQAALWTGVKERYAQDVLLQAREALAAGDESTWKNYIRVAGEIRDARSYSDLAAEPKIAAQLEKWSDTYAGHGPALLQQMEDDVLGAIKFGPDYTSSIQLFRNADLSTVTHEYGHLMRRLLPEDQANILEDAFGAVRSRFTHTPEQIKLMASRVEGASVPLKPLNELPMMRELYEAVTGPGGTGFTFDLHAGKMYSSSKGYGVSITPGTAAKLPVSATYEEFRSAANEFVQEYRPLLEKERVHFGGWVENGQIHLDPSEIVSSLKEARKLGLERRQEGVFRFKDFETIALDKKQWSPMAPEFAFQRPGVTWSRDAEEQFAQTVEKFFMSKTAPNAKTGGALEALRQSLGNLWGRFRGYSGDRNLINPRVRKVLDGWFGDVTEALAPTTQPRGIVSARAKHALVGAGAGAALGAVEGDDKVHDALLGAGGGLALGLGTDALLNKSFGYLPDYLLKVGSALRYSLSPAFDARRLVKQNLLAATKYDLPFIGNTRRYITAHYGEEAWTESMKVLEQVHGVNYVQDLDVFDRTLYAGGITGYSPLLRQAGHAYLLRKRGWDDAKIANALRELYAYGTGRSPLEKTVNFVFFPFSFEKKLLTAVGDFILQAPGRNLLITEGLRRYHQLKTFDVLGDKTIGDFLDAHAPLLQRLQDFNAFAHGVSPGRFLLEGVIGSEGETHRTGVGQASQVLANFFVPGGGSLTSVHEAIGGYGDLAVHAFTPIVVTGESIDRLRASAGLTSGSGLDQFFNIANDYVPMVKDLNNFWTAAGDQMKALTHGEDQWSQLTDYMSGISESKAGLQPMASALGYSSVDGLLQSQMGSSFQQSLETQKYELQNKYPDGFNLSTTFQDNASIQKKALMDVMNKTNPNYAEQGIQAVAKAEQGAQFLSQVGLPADVYKTMIANQVRTAGMKYAGDVRFNELWSNLFAYTYGPLRMVA